MSLLTALVPTADWSGPAWWVVLFPVGWFLFFLLVFLTFRFLGPWGPGRGHARCPRDRAPR
jgi:hypothetical protein